MCIGQSLNCNCQQTETETDRVIIRIHHRPEEESQSRPVAGVLDEPYSQLTPLSGVAVQARLSP